MVHSRLYGYRCHHVRHNELAREMELDIALNSHVLTDEEIEEFDNALDGNPPIEFSERFQRRALDAMKQAQKKRAIRFN